MTKDITKIDPLTLREFIPKRENQRFENPKNRIIYNNKRASKQRKEWAAFEKPCQASYKVLKSLFVTNEKSKKYNMYFLEGKGLDFSAYNHQIHHDLYGKLFAYYEFAIRRIDQTDDYQIIKYDRL